MPSWSPGPKLLVLHSTLLALVIPGSRPNPVTQAGTCRTSLLQPHALACPCAMLNPTLLDPATPAESGYTCIPMDTCSRLALFYPSSSPVPMDLEPSLNGMAPGTEIHEDGPQHHAHSQRFRLQDRRWMPQLNQRKHTFPPPLTFFNYLILLLCPI